MGDDIGIVMRTDRPTVIDTVSAKAPGHVHIEQMNEGLYHLEIGDRHFEMVLVDGCRIDLLLFEDVEGGEDGGRGSA